MYLKAGRTYVKNGLRLSFLNQRTRSNLTPGRRVVTSQGRRASSPWLTSNVPTASAKQQNNVRNKSIYVILSLCSGGLALFFCGDSE
jgi:hypothetical protein